MKNNVCKYILKSRTNKSTESKSTPNKGLSPILHGANIHKQQLQISTSLERIHNYSQKA